MSGVLVEAGEVGEVQKDGACRRDMRRRDLRRRHSGVRTATAVATTQLVLHGRGTRSVAFGRRFSVRCTLLRPIARSPSLPWLVGGLPTTRSLTRARETAERNREET